MTISKRLTALTASGFVLAATPEAHAWRMPRPASSTPPDPAQAGFPPLPWLADPAGASVRTPPPEKPPITREVIVFASGFALAAAAATGIWMLLGADSSPMPGSPKTGVAAPCSIAHALAAASGRDGRFPLQADVAGLQAANITSFMLIGNSAAAARRRSGFPDVVPACRQAQRCRLGRVSRH